MACNEWWRRIGAIVFAGLAASCGGGGDDGGSASCSPAPSINSTPPTVSVVGQQYRYHVQFTLACIPFVTSCGVDLLQGPPGAGLDPIRVAVFWSPSAGDAGTTQQFSIATKSDPCGHRATQAWSVTVQ